jgi:hypothetical protein
MHSCDHLFRPDPTTHPTTTFWRLRTWKGLTPQSMRRHAAMV